jgi:hypothetical protein
MDNDYREAFLKANANPEFIASEIADLIRSLVRAFAADDPSSPTLSAVQKMEFVLDLIRRCDEPLTWYKLFTAAFDEIHEAIPDDPYDRMYIHAAQRGMKYLVERSALDNAARGRASRRLDEFRQAIEWAQHSRTAR